METSFVKFIGAATCAWVLSYLIDLLDLLPSEEGDMLRDAMPTYHCKHRNFQYFCDICRFPSVFFGILRPFMLYRLPKKIRFEGGRRQQYPRHWAAKRLGMATFRHQIFN